MKIQILDKTKKKKILEELEMFGVEKAPYLFVRSGKERIRAFSGSLSNEEVMEVWRNFPIEGVGLYFAREIIDKNGVREVKLSLDGLHLLQKQINDRILVLSEEQEKKWFEGKNVEFLEEEGGEIDFDGYVALKSSDEKDFIGIGKISKDKKVLYNFLPKERRRH